MTTMEIAKGYSSFQNALVRDATSIRTLIAEASEEMWADTGAYDQKYFSLPFHVVINMEWSAGKGSFRMVATMVVTSNAPPEHTTLLRTALDDMLARKNRLSSEEWRKMALGSWREDD